VFDVTPFVKEIGRGAAGARALSREQTAQLWSAILRGEVEPVALGAILMAYRIKGETAHELAGMLDAIHQIIQPIDSHSRMLAQARPVVLPSMNGARHSANLTLLLAQLLAREGVPTLVHAVSHDPKRVTTLAIATATGLPIARDSAEMAQHLSATKLAIVSTASLCAPLDALLRQRWTMGVRNSSHTLAKMLCPFAKSCNAIQVVSVTHPEYMTAMREFYLDASLATSDCVLMRGTEGEPVRSSKRPQAMELLRINERRELIAATEGSVTDVAPIPTAIDAQTTAQWIQSVLNGANPVPPVISEQVRALVALARAI
jgi:anthranilate phosphoribosyltransferase